MDDPCDVHNPCCPAHAAAAADYLRAEIVQQCEAAFSAAIAPLTERLAKANREMAELFS